MRTIYLVPFFFGLTVCLGFTVCLAQSSETAREIVELEVARKVMDVDALEQHFRDRLSHGGEQLDVEPRARSPKPKQPGSADEAKIREILQRFGNEEKKKD